MEAHPHLAAVLSVAVLSVVPAFGEPFRLEKKFDLAPGGRFVLTADVGGVTLQGVAGQQVSIVVTADREDLAERVDFRFEPRAGELKMIVEQKDKGLMKWFRQVHGHVNIAIEVPRATAVDLRTAGGPIDLSALDAAVKANSSGGSVKITDVRGDVALSSSGGGVEARSVHGAVRLDSSGGSVRGDSIDGSVYAETSGGSLTLATVSGDVTASSSGGGVHIQGVGGRVKAGSSGGPVDVVFAAGNSKGGEIDSSGGGVAATVDPAVGLDVDAASSGGSVRCDLPVTIQGKVSSDRLQGKLNGGGPLLHLRSSGGGITINRR